MTSALSTPPRPTAARLARLHLRTGSTALARAELETLAGRDALDDEAVADLAEVRWRTGDLSGAGEAARAYLESGRESTLALAIAAEAAEATGHPTEARRLADRALARAGGSLEDLFAGEPRSGVWPPDRDRSSQGPLFESPARYPAGPGGAVDEAGAFDGSVIGATGAAAQPDGLWELVDDTRRPSPALPDARDALAAGREALGAGRSEEAAIHLALALRVMPELAPLVIELAASRPSSALDLVRGDAFRLVGRETAAREAWADAARRLRTAPDASPVDPHAVPEETP